MVEGELFYGVEKSERRDENRERELKAKAEAAGRRVDDADVIIAATALRHGAVLVTGNTRHFSRFEGLKIDDWR